jgi:acid phosphatase class B
MVFKDTRAQVEKAWTTTKKVLAAMSVWGLVFSLVTIGRLSVGFDYDGTLVDSSKAFEKAAKLSQQAGGASYWGVVNNSYEMESAKLVPYGTAILLRALGFRIVIMAERQGTDGDALRKEWRRLAPRGFLFTPDPASKHLHMQEGRFVAFFGDADMDMLEAKKAGVLAMRVQRPPSPGEGVPYSPGKMGDYVVPLSRF